MSNSGAPSNIALVGFMGAGKSTIGRHLAAELGLSFVDSDAEVEKKLGCSIPEAFSVYGEGVFRQSEAQVIQALVQGEGQVIATGGGAVGDARTWEALLPNCLVVWLHAGVEELLSRTGDSGAQQRPLLANKSRNDVVSLYQERLPLYAKAHLTVAATKPIEESVAQIKMAWLSKDATSEQVRVHLPQRSYTVNVGKGLLPHISRYLDSPPQKALVVADSVVANIYGEHVLHAMRAEGWDCSLAIFPAGEESKNLATLSRLYTAAVNARLDRGSTIVAVGGGVVGDIAGFLAATYLRGVKFIQVPTTLLAQVDSSVGGKVAVDLPEGKNLVGAFYQPQVVVADLYTLISLPIRQLLSGLSEVIKHGIIADVELFAFIENNIADILAKDAQALSKCVTRSCRIKGTVVERDEREAGLREILNFGHTVGHAIEVVTGYKKYTHGEAVAMGMVAAARLSTSYGLSEATVTRICALLHKAGLPYTIPDVPIDALLAACWRDKKVRQGKLRFTLVSALGKAQSSVAVDEEAVRAVLEWQRKLRL